VNIAAQRKWPVGSLPPSKPPPARHRSGARSARRGGRRHPTQSTHAKETTISFRSILDSLRSAARHTEAHAPHRRPGFRPRLESLEDRSAPATFTVLNLADNGNDSLRAAVAATNANPGADMIEFAEVLNGTKRFTPQSQS
jgi:hypothetical protein